MSSKVVSHNEKERIAKGIEDALKKDFPISSKNERVKLNLDEVFVDDSNDALEKNPNYINEARTKAQSYELPVKGKFSVKKDGKTVDTHETKLGPYFPIVENLGTRMVDGNNCGRADPILNTWKAG